MLRYRNEDGSFDGYRLIVIPDGINMTENLVRKLKNFKGAIISAGRSYADSDPWSFFTAEEDTNTDGYYSICGEVYGQYSVAVKMKSDYSVADYVEPYFRREFDGTHAYFYNPPKDCIGYSSIAMKDSVAHFGFKPFEAYLSCGAMHIKNTVKSVIDKLLPDPLIRAGELPSTARATVMKCPEGVLLHIKTTVPEHRGTLGIIEEHSILPSGKRIGVKGEYSKAYLLPSMTEISVTVKDGYTELTLPEIVGYAPFLLV